MEATIKGHIRQTFKGYQSTQPKPQPLLETLPETTQQHTNQNFLKVVDLTYKIYTHQTGRFPVTSSRGYKYIMIEYEYYSNNLHA